MGHFDPTPSRGITSPYVPPASPKQLCHFTFPKPFPTKAGWWHKAPIKWPPIPRGWAASARGQESLLQSTLFFCSCFYFPFFLLLYLLPSSFAPPLPAAWLYKCCKQTLTPTHRHLPQQPPHLDFFTHSPIHGPCPGTCQVPSPRMGIFILLLSSTQGLAMVSLPVSLGCPQAF